jgi:transposase
VGGIRNKRDYCEFTPGGAGRGCYSYDLRSKVLAAIQQDGMKISVVSQLFNISRNPIDLWLKRQAETGDFKALPNRPPGNNHKITDWDKFHEASQNLWG